MWLLMNIWIVFLVLGLFCWFMFVILKLVVILGSCDVGFLLWELDWVIWVLVRKIGSVIL